MVWNPLSLITSRASQFRLVHERWLNRAVKSPGRYPRIPTRRVDSGGFSGLLSRPNGEVLAERWWDLALQRVDLDG